MSASTNHEANLDDDLFGNGASSKSSGHTSHRDQTDQESKSDAGYTNDYDDEEFEDSYDDEPNNDLTEPKLASEIKKRNANRMRIVVVLGLGLLAMLGIVGFLWKMTVSANGFKAPVPAEPIDVAEKESKRLQPTDYADEEQIRTMNYDGVNSIYGLALKKQQENRMATKDSTHQNLTIQRELARSDQLRRKQNAQRTATKNNYSNSTRRNASQYAYESNGYNSSYNGRTPSYGDLYRANPIREQVLLQAGFNTVKAEGNDRTSFGSPQTLSPASLATVETEHNPVEDNEPIPGVVSGDQTIMNGTRVMFRTLADAKIRDRFAPKGSILVGFAQLGSNRAVFNITTLRLSTGEAVPVRLRALDPDMNEGLALQSDKPVKQQIDQSTNNALSQAAGQAAWSAGYSINQATRVPVAGNAIASLGAGLASAATMGRRRETLQKLNLQDGFKVFFIPYK